jgi:hypothetical protein
VSVCVSYTAIKSSRWCTNPYNGLNVKREHLQTVEIHTVFITSFVQRFSKVLIRQTGILPFTFYRQFNHLHATYGYLVIERGSHPLWPYYTDIYP